MFIEGVKFAFSQIARVLNFIVNISLQPGLRILDIILFMLLVDLILKFFTSWGIPMFSAAVRVVGRNNTNRSNKNTLRKGIDK